MSNQKAYHEIEKIKHQIFDATLLVGTILGILAFALGPADTSASWYQNFDYVSNIVFLILLSVVFDFRKRIPIRTKSIVVIFLLFGFFITDLLTFGVYSFDKVLIVIIPFYGMIVYSYRSTIMMYMAAVAVFLIIGFLYVNDYIRAPAYMIDRMTQTDVWIESILILTMVALVIFILNRKYNQSFKDLIFDLEHKNKVLAARDAKLKSEKDFTDKLLNIIPGVFYLYKKNGHKYKLVRWNKPGETEFGYKSDELKGMGPEDFFSPDYHDIVSKELREVEKKGFGNAEMPIRTKDGEGPWYYFEGHNFSHEHDEFFLGIGIDITKRKKAEEEIARYNRSLEDLVRERTAELKHTLDKLHSLNEKLEENVKERTSELELRNKQLMEYAFINSHLLRAPLARLLGLSDLISKEAQLPADKELWTRFTTETRDLDTIIRKISELLIHREELNREDILSSFDSADSDTIGNKSPHFRLIVMFGKHPGAFVTKLEVSWPGISLRQASLILLFGALED